MLNNNSLYYYIKKNFKKKLKNGETYCIFLYLCTDFLKDSIFKIKYDKYSKGCLCCKFFRLNDLSVNDDKT